MRSRVVALLAAVVIALVLAVPPAFTQTNVGAALFVEIYRIVRTEALSQPSSEVLLKGADAGLAPLIRCRQLRTLNLRETDVTDDGVWFLTRCKNLQALSLAWTKVTDDGLESLAACKRLTELNVWKTRDDDLKWVGARWKKIRITDRGVKDLRKALPKLKVNR